MTLALEYPLAAEQCPATPVEPPALRPYQQDAVDAVLDADGREVPSVLGVAATGLGKTIIVGALARALGRRTLVLAHREQLIDQAVEKVAWCWPGARVGAVQGARDATGGDVVVASVQTLIQPGRLERLGGDFGLVVVDECHHAPARSYGRILEGLGAGVGPGGPLLVGVTATPDRGDAASLESIFVEQVFSYDLVWGIRKGYLSDLVGKRVRLELDLSEVGVRGGDYDDESLGRAMERAGAPFHIVEAWCEHAPTRRTVVFVPTIRVAEETAEAFRARGIAAGTVSDGDRSSRKDTLAAFSAGDIQVLVNCAVLTEGYDEPRVDCIVLARPTRSKALYMQCVGRGTRRHPEKGDCLVLDMTGASDEDRDLVGLA
ncbi:MAG: DEAD/DEAH box helicase, partial [Acidimicrobiales bacterium]